MEVNHFYDQVKVSTDARAAHPNCDLLGIREDSPQPTCTIPTPGVCLFSELVGWQCRPYDRVTTHNVHPSVCRSWPPLQFLNDSQIPGHVAGVVHVPGRKEVGHHRIEADLLEYEVAIYICIQ